MMNWDGRYGAAVRSSSMPYRPSSALNSGSTTSTYGPSTAESLFPGYRLPKPIWEFDPFVYRVNDGQGVQPQNPMTILHEVFKERGWKEYGIEEQRLIKGNVMGWNLCWRTNFAFTSPPRSLFTWQFTNNIPKAIGFCNKEYLARYIICMQEVYGSIFDFSPATFIMPRDFWRLDVEHTRRAELAKNSDINWSERARNLVPHQIDPAGDTTDTDVPRNFSPVWIAKPIGKSQGRGITVINNIELLAASDIPAVVQEYIARPLLIGGHKFDLRIYVVVASAFPLSIYVYREGLTRFATEKYDMTDLGNTCSHLTNVSINKLSPEYEKDKELIGLGCKWPFKRLRQYLDQKDIADWYMWQRIISIIVLTLIGEANRGGFVPHTKNCFEFLGYDVLVDEDMRPWLLEVNHCPGLNGDCDVDYDVKNPMLHDLFNLLGLPIFAPKKPETARCSTARPGTTTNPEFITSMKRDRDSNSSNTEKPTRIRTHRGKNRGQTLRNRLIDMTAIYTQDVGNHLRPETAGIEKKPKKKKLIPPKKEQTIDESISSKEKRGFRSRDWTKPIKQCGGWVRVFPFDDSTTDQCRGRLGFDVKLIVNRIYSVLKAARQISLDKPGHKDGFYATALKRMCRLTSEVWLPPTLSSKENNEPAQQNISDTI